jgi:hypothetical protein
MTKAEELTAAERADLLAAIPDFEKAASDLMARIKSKAEICDRVGIEKVDWPLLVGIAAETEMLRRVEVQLALAKARLGIPPATAH